MSLKWRPSARIFSIAMFLLCSCGFALGEEKKCITQAVGPQLGGDEEDLRPLFKHLQERNSGKSPFRRRSPVRKFAGKLGALYFYPTIVPFRLGNAAQKVLEGPQPRALHRIPFEFLRSDGAYIAGYFLLVHHKLGPGSLADAIKTPLETYNRLADDSTSVKASGATVIINTVSESSSVLTSIASDEAARECSDKENCHFRQVASVAELRSTLESIRAQHGKIGKLTLFAHSTPGSLFIHDEKVDATNAAQLKATGLFSRGANIKLIACSLGQNTWWSDDGERVVRKLGEALLDEGGQIVASTRDIYVPTDKGKAKLQLSGPQKVALEYFLAAYGQPFRAIEAVGLQVISKDGEERIRTVIIPPREKPML